MVAYSTHHDALGPRDMILVIDDEPQIRQDVNHDGSEG
jgi:hypothetical protein